MRTKEWRQGVLVGVLVLASLWLLSLTWGLVGKAHIAVSQAHQAEEEHRALKTRKAALEANLAALTTERGQDTAIRTAFGVARPGEEVIVVVPSTIVTATVTPTWWQKILHWF